MLTELPKNFMTAPTTEQWMKKITKKKKTENKDSV